MFVSFCEALGMPVDKNVSKVSNLVKCILNLPAYIISTLAVSLVLMAVTPYGNDIQSQSKTIVNKLSRVSKSGKKIRKAIENIKKMLKAFKKGLDSAFKMLKAIVKFLFNFSSPITWIMWAILILVTALVLMSVLIGRYGTFQGELTIDVGEMRELNQDESEYTDLLNEAALRQSFYESVSDSSYYQAFSASDALGRTQSINDAITEGFLRLFNQNESDSRIEKLRLKYGTSDGNSDSFGASVLEFFGITLPTLDSRGILADANKISADYLMQAESLGTYADSFGMTSYFRDYWGREENFTLSADLLYELNRWVYGNDLSSESIIYPEAFTQPVAYVYDYCRICTDGSSVDYGNPYVYLTQRVTLDDIRDTASPYYGWTAYEGIIVSEPSTIVYDYAVMTGGLATESSTISYGDGTSAETQKLVRLYWYVKDMDETDGEDALLHQMDLNYAPEKLFDGPYLQINGCTLSVKLQDVGTYAIEQANGSVIQIKYEDNKYPTRHYQLVSITDSDGDIQVSSRNLFNRSYVKVPVIRSSYRNSDEYWERFDEFIAEDQAKAPYAPFPTAGCTYQVDGQMTYCEMSDGKLVSRIEPDDWTQKKGSVILYYYGTSDCVHTVSTIVDNIRGVGAGAVEEADAQVIMAILLEFENYLCSYGTEGVEWEYAYHTYSSADEDETINTFYTGANLFKHMDNQENQTRYVATYDAAIELSNLSTLSTEYVSVGVSSCLNDESGETWGWRVVMKNGYPCGIQKVYGEISYEFPTYYTQEQGKIWTEGTWRKAYNITGEFATAPAINDWRIIPALDEAAYTAATPTQWQYGSFNFINQWQRNSTGKYVLTEVSTGVDWGEWRKVLACVVEGSRDKYEIAYHSIPSDYDDLDNATDAARLLFDTRNDDEAWNPYVTVYRPDASSGTMMASSEASGNSGRVTTVSSATDYLAMELKSVRDYGLGSVLSYQEARKVTYISGLAVTQSTNDDAVEQWFNSYFGTTVGTEVANTLAGAALKGMYSSALLKETTGVNGVSVTLEDVLCGSSAIRVAKYGTDDWQDIGETGIVLTESDLKKIADGLNMLQGTGKSVYAYNTSGRTVSFTVTYVNELESPETAGGYFVAMRADNTWYSTNIRAIIPYLQKSVLANCADYLGSAWQAVISLFNSDTVKPDTDAEAKNQFFDPVSYYELWYDFNEGLSDDNWYDKVIASVISLVETEGLVKEYDTDAAKQLRETIALMEKSGAAGSADSKGFFAGILAYLFPDTSAGQYVTTDQLTQLSERFGDYIQPISLVDETATGEVYLIEEAVTFLGNFLYTYDTQLLVAGDIENENKIVSGVSYADRYSALSHYIFNVPVETRAIRASETLYSKEYTLTKETIQAEFGENYTDSIMNDAAQILSHYGIRKILSKTDPAYSESVAENAIKAVSLSKYRSSVEQVACISNVQMLTNNGKVTYRWAYRYIVVYKTNGVVAESSSIYVDAGLELQELCNYLLCNGHADVAERVILGMRIYDEDAIDASEIGQDYSLVNEEGFRADYLHRHPYAWATVQKVSTATADYGFTDGYYGKLSDVNEQIKEIIEDKLVFAANAASSFKLDSDGNYDDIGIDAPLYVTADQLSSMLLTDDDMTVIAEAIVALYGPTYQGQMYYIQSNEDGKTIDYGDYGKSDYVDYYAESSVVFGLAPYADYGANGVWNNRASGTTDGGDLCKWIIRNGYAVPNFFKVASAVHVDANTNKLVLNDTQAITRAQGYRDGNGHNDADGAYANRLYYSHNISEGLSASDISVGVAIANRQTYGTAIPTFTKIYGSKIQIAPKLTGSYFNEEVYADWLTRISDSDTSTGSTVGKDKYLLNYHNERLSYLYDYLVDFETYLPLSVLSDDDLRARAADSYRSVGANTTRALEYTTDYIALIKSKVNTASWNIIYGGYVITSAGVRGFDIDADTHLAAGVSETDYIIDDVAMAQYIAGLIETSYEYGPYVMIEYLNTSRNASDKIEHSYDNYAIIRDAMDRSRTLRSTDAIPKVTLYTESGATTIVDLIYVGAGAIPMFGTSRLTTANIAEGVTGFGSVTITSSDRLDPEKSIEYVTVKFGKLLYKYGNVVSATMAYFYGEEYWDALLQVAKPEGESTGPEWKTDNADLIESALDNIAKADGNSIAASTHAYPYINSGLDNGVEHFYTADVVEYALSYVEAPTARLRMIRLSTSVLGSAAATVGLRASYAADLLDRWNDAVGYMGEVAIAVDDGLVGFYHNSQWQYVDEMAAEYDVDIGIVVAIAMEASDGNPYYGLFTSEYQNGGNGTEYHLSAVSADTACRNGTGMFALPDGRYNVNTLNYTVIDTSTLSINNLTRVGLKMARASFADVCYAASDADYGIGVGKTVQGKEQVLKGANDFKNTDPQAYSDALEAYLQRDMRYSNESVYLYSLGKDVSVPSSAKYVVLRLASLHQNNDVLSTLYQYYYGIYGGSSLFKYSLSELKQQAVDNGYGANWYGYYDSIVATNKIKTALEYYDVSLAMETETHVNRSVTTRSMSEMSGNDDVAYTIGKYAVYATKQISAVSHGKSQAVKTIAHGTKFACENVYAGDVAVVMSYLGTTPSYYFDTDSLARFVDSAYHVNVRSASFVCGSWIYTNDSGQETVVDTNEVVKRLLNRKKAQGDAFELSVLTDMVANQDEFGLNTYTPVDGYADDWGLHYTIDNIPENDIQTVINAYEAQYEAWKADGTLPAGTSFKYSQSKAQDATTYSVICSYRDYSGTHIKKQIYKYTTSKGVQDIINTTLYDADGTKLTVAAVKRDDGAWMLADAAAMTPELSDVLASIGETADNPVSVIVYSVSCSMYGNDVLSCPNGEWPDFSVFPESVRATVPTAAYTYKVTGTIKHDKLFGTLTLYYDETSSRDVDNESECGDGEQFVNAGYDVTTSVTWHFSSDSSWNIVSNGYSLTAVSLFSNTSSFNEYTQDRLAEYVSGITVFDSSPFAGRDDVNLAIMSVVADKDDAFKSIYDYSLLSYFVGTRETSATEKRSWMQISSYHTNQGRAEKVVLTDIGQGTINIVPESDINDLPPLIPLTSVQSTDIVYAYGISENPLSGGTITRRGLVLALPSETGVRSMCDGTIVEYGHIPEYGNYLIVEYSVAGITNPFGILSSANGDRYKINGIRVLYGYLNDKPSESVLNYRVLSGDTLPLDVSERGTVLKTADIGLSGHSTGNQLYLEIRVNVVEIDAQGNASEVPTWRTVDPQPYLTSSWQIVAK